MGATQGAGHVRGVAANAAQRCTPLTVDLWGEAIAATAWDDWPAK